MSFSNNLTPAALERLACLAEEMGEAIQIIGKIIRHGYESHSPIENEGRLNNREMLEHELGDVRHWMDAMCAAGDVSERQIQEWAHAKAYRVAPYLHHQALPVPKAGTP